MIDTMTNVNAVIDRYIDAWNESNPAARMALIDETWTEDAVYIDPLVAASGREAIAATIGAVQEQFPGFTFRLAGQPDSHHNLARFTWELAASAEAVPLVVGFDVAVLSEDGRLRAVHGFLDKVPEIS
ncbi:MAG TPA: nuclear transport factor 2 family protein [Thermomicrobiales bacterium]|nr:nuclear transport factor 2 family protein [Thermomicrobiales bacterium]